MALAFVDSFDIPTESGKASSTKARGGRETEKDDKSAISKATLGTWAPIEAHLAPLYPLMNVLRRIELGQMTPHFKSK